MLIAIEGMDGTGKTTLVKQLCEILTQRNIQFVNTKEPSHAFRDLLINSFQTGEFSSFDRTLFALMSRKKTIEQIILPALSQSKIVITDRYSLSTFAIQGFTEHHLALIESITQATPVLQTKPSYTLYAQCPTSIAYDRIANRKNNNAYESSVKFHEFSTLHAVFDNLAYACMDSSLTAHKYGQSSIIPIDTSKTLQDSLSSLEEFVNTFIVKS